MQIRKRVLFGAAAVILVVAAFGGVWVLRSGSAAPCTDEVDLAEWSNGRREEAKRMVRCDVLVGHSVRWVRQRLTPEDDGSPRDALYWNLDYGDRDEELVVEFDPEGRVTDQYISKSQS